jgi:hypothetical protein
MNSGSLPLLVCFKGNRDYLQGGDLCNAIMENVRLGYGGEVSRFKLAFHRFISHQPDAFWVDGEDSLSRPSNRVADFTVTGTNGNVNGWLVESDRQVNCRVPFDEDRIARLCKMSGESISIRGDAGYLPIEIAVSMTKQLHNSLLNVSAGRWVFTKLDMRRLFQLDDATSLTITLKENLYNRLTKSEITVGSDLLGAIYFSLVRS